MAYPRWEDSIFTLLLTLTGLTVAAIVFFIK